MEALKGVTTVVTFTVNFGQSRSPNVETSDVFLPKTLAYVASVARISLAELVANVISNKTYVKPTLNLPTLKSYTSALAIQLSTTLCEFAKSEVWSTFYCVSRGVIKQVSPEKNIFSGSYVTWQPPQDKTKALNGAICSILRYHSSPRCQHLFCLIIALSEHASSPKLHRLLHYHLLTN